MYDFLLQRHDYVIHCVSCVDVVFLEWVLLSTNVPQCFWQVEVMKSNVESRVQAFQQELDKFSARWHQLKPRDIDEYNDKQSCLAAVSSINERRAEFAELEENMKKLM